MVTLWTEDPDADANGGCCSGVGEGFTGCFAGGRDQAAACGEKALKPGGVFGFLVPRAKYDGVDEGVALHPLGSLAGSGGAQGLEASWAASLTEDVAFGSASASSRTTTEGVAS